MTTIACVLRSGGDFDASWVRALHTGVRQHLIAPHRFVCMTDMNVDLDGVEVVPLKHGWPGWWSKVEVFRLDGRVLYIDLDTLPVDNLADLASYTGRIAFLNGFFRRKQLASGVIAFNSGAHTERIYRAFRKDPEGIMQAHKARSDYWYAKVVGEHDRLQDLYPGQLESIKRGARTGPPDNCRLACGHGTPRLSDPEAGWAHELWTRRAYPDTDSEQAAA